MTRLVLSLLLFASFPAFAATVTHEAATADTGATPNTSGAFTPVSGDLLVVGVCMTDIAPTGVDATVSLTSSIGGFTFTQVKVQSFGGAIRGGYVFVSDALVSSATSQTVTVTPTSTATGSVIMVAAVAGVTRTGLDAIRQFAGKTDGSNPHAPVFGVSALTGNPTLGFHCDLSNPATITEPTGWTEQADVGYNTPSAGGEYVSRDSGFTGTTITWGSGPPTSGAAITVEIDTSSSTPNLTSAPAISARTTSSISVDYTSDTTGTLYAARLTDGSGTPTCDQLEAQTATGGIQYASDAASATVADTVTFSSITDGTLSDGYFCLEGGTGVDSAVASIANMYKLPAFTTALTIASQTSSAYTSNNKVLDGAGTVTLVSCAKDSTPPTVAQVEAHTGGCIIDFQTDDATGPMTLSVALGTPFPLYDLYYVGTYGSQHEASVNVLQDEVLDPPSGKQFVTVGTLDANSPLFGQSPTIVSGDIWVLDTLSDTTGYVITAFDTGLVSIAAGGDSSRQSWDNDVYDVSLAGYYGAAKFYLNNHAPTVIESPGNPGVFFDGTVYLIGSSPDRVLVNSSEDAEGDTIVYSLVGGSLPTDWVLASDGELSDGSPGACGSHSFTIRMVDITGDYTDVPNTVEVGPAVPDVEDVAEATAISTIEALCSLTATAGVAQYNETIAIGNVVETDPAIGEVVGPTQDVLYSLSLGPSPDPIIDFATPNLVGLTEAQANAAVLAVAPWRTGIVSVISGDLECSNPPEGLVVSQSPEAGVISTPYGDIMIHAGFIPQMPDLVGMTVAEAAVILAALCD